MSVPSIENSNAPLRTLGFPNMTLGKPGKQRSRVSRIRHGRLRSGRRLEPDDTKPPYLAELLREVLAILAVAARLDRGPQPLQYQHPCLQALPRLAPCGSPRTLEDRK